MRSHPTARRLTPLQKAITRQILKYGITTNEMLSSLRQNDPLFKPSAGRIYNERNNYKNEELMGRLPIEPLLDEVN